jgi:AAA+ superfamily predicted ATPase
LRKAKSFSNLSNIIQDDNPIIKHIQVIAEEARASQLSQDFQEKVSVQAKRVAKFFSCSDFQAILFSIVFNLNFRSSVDISDLAQFIDCSMIGVSTQLNDIEILVQKGILHCNKSNSKRPRRQSTNLNQFEYSVNREVFESIIRNDAKYEQNIKTINDVFDFLRSCSMVFKDDSLEEEDLEDEIHAIINESHHLSFIQELSKLTLPQDSMTLYFAFCVLFTAGEDLIDLPEVVEKIFDYKDRLKIRREFLNNQHPLQKHGLIQLQGTDFKSDRLVSLTDRSLEMLFKDDKIFFTNRRNEVFNQISPDKVVEKRLFFDDSLQKQLDTVTNILSEPFFTEYKVRLRQAGSKEAITILLHGASGSGKSEFCYQLCKKTNRPLIMVDLSSMRSKWFGETEKLVKNMFSSYMQKVRHEKITPILLINEADGLLSVRQPLGKDSNSVTSTINTSQNIMLQMLEDLDQGAIVIAVSNLIFNIDDAFTRRFYLRILFLRSCSPLVRFNIWQNLIMKNAQSNPILPEKELWELTKFDLSGAQIENVCKKALMNHLVNGTIPDLKDFSTLCIEEGSFKNVYVNRIGYIK